MAFRGIGDSATTVKMQQDQNAIQRDQTALSAAISAASRAESARQFNIGRAENARQFNASANMQEGRLAEDARRFDTTMAAQAENTAWTRSQEEKKMAEDTRRFGIAQEASARGEQRQERQLDLQQFGAELNALHTASSMEANDMTTRKSSAQLQQYLAAMDEEKQASGNREKIAKGAFGSLVIAGRLNGGVMPSRTVELANRELGDKENQIVGGGFDENTGLAWFDVKNLKDNTVKQLKMTPESQYSAIREGIGEKEADMFYETFKIGSSTRAAIDRHRLGLQESIAVDAQKQANRLALQANDPMKRADALEKAAAAYEKQAGYGNPNATADQRKKYSAEAARLSDEAFKLRESTLPQEPKAKPFVITPAIQSKFGIPPAGSKTVQNADGGYTVLWKDNGKLYKQDFAPGEW